MRVGPTEAQIVGAFLRSPANELVGLDRWVPPPAAELVDLEESAVTPIDLDEIPSEVSHPLTTLAGVPFTG
jgi:hypothetical protein